mmetsp:Transcript_17592/g.53187  ORF Transcript_17592/g.53187 Transcript_17592/m.53187 type:complete len:251 (-) Transcript_17592:862-1614(-)
MSLPARSPICSGPIANPSRRIGPSTWAGTHPSSSKNNASRQYPSIIRLPTNPKQLPTSTAFLPRRLPIAITVASVSPDEALPRTFSSSGITLAGEKKWVPQTSCGREVAAAIWSMSRVEVLLQSRAPGLTTPSSSAKIFFLRSIRSKTASITISALATFESEIAVAVLMQPIRCSSLASLSLPFLTFASYNERIPLRRVASASADKSTNVTGMPLLAKHIAMPPPIVPAPMTAAFSMGRGLSVTPATLDI